MGITGTLSEFLLMLALGGILLVVGVVLTSGLESTEHGWKLPKAHWVFSVLFFIFAGAVVLLAFMDKFSDAKKSVTPIEVNHLTLDWGKNTATNSNSQRVELTPSVVADKRVPARQAWEWRAVTKLKREFAGKPDILVSLTELDGDMAGKRYWLSAIALGGNEYEVRLIVWGLSNEGIPSLAFQVDCIAVGAENAGEIK